MRTVTWLHISDFHFRECEKQPRQTVLSAMLEDITTRCKNGMTVDFILVTGDLAFSGIDSEYNLVSNFLSDLSTATSLSHEGHTKLEIAPFLKVARKRGITDAGIQAFYDYESDQDVDVDVPRIPLEGYRDYDLFRESLGIIYIDFRRDIYSDVVEYTRDGTQWKPINQDIEDAIKSEIEKREAHIVKTKKDGEKHVPLHWGRDKWQQYRNTRTYEHQVNTFTE